MNLIHVLKKKKNRALLQPGKSEPRPWPEKEGFYFQTQHTSLSLDVFKKKKEKRNQKRKEEKLTSKTAAPKLQPLTTVYAIFALFPGVIVGDKA